jgi:hypothetical protein
VVQVADAVDTWLIEQHQLPAPQRWQVRNAVRYGRELPDPALRRAAYGLAGCAMRGELSMGRGLRAAAIIPFVLGTWWMVKGTAALRIAEQGPARACQLNA